MISEHKVTDDIVTEDCSLSGTKSLPAYTDADLTFNVSKSGYTPLGIVGWRFDPYYIHISKILSITKTEITIRIVNMYTNTVNVGTKVITVLYKKD